MTLTTEQAEALSTLIEYNWKDELDDYHDCETANDNQREGHIFELLVLLANAIDGTNKTPADHLKEKFGNS